MKWILKFYVSLDMTTFNNNITTTTLSNVSFSQTTFSVALDPSQANRRRWFSSGTAVDQAEEAPAPHSPRHWLLPFRRVFVSSRFAGVSLPRRFRPPVFLCSAATAAASRSAVDPSSKINQLQFRKSSSPFIFVRTTWLCYFEVNIASSLKMLYSPIQT